MVSGHQPMEPMGNVRFGSNTSIWYQNNIEIPFFNYYLKGKGDMSKLAKPIYSVSGANEWKQFATMAACRKKR